MIDRATRRARSGAASPRAARPRGRRWARRCRRSHPAGAARSASTSRMAGSMCSGRIRGNGGSGSSARRGFSMARHSSRCRVITCGHGGLVRSGGHRRRQRRAGVRPARGRIWCARHTFRAGPTRWHMCERGLHPQEDHVVCRGLRRSSCAMRASTASRSQLRSHDWGAAQAQARCLHRAPQSDLRAQSRQPQGRGCCARGPGSSARGRSRPADDDHGGARRDRNRRQAAGPGDSRCARSASLPMDSSSWRRARSAWPSSAAATSPSSSAGVFAALGTKYDDGVAWRDAVARLRRHDRRGGDAQPAGGGCRDRFHSMPAARSRATPMERWSSHCRMAADSGRSIA